jgi:glycopeptide antibiotics resistance protein
MDGHKRPLQIPLSLKIAVAIAYLAVMIWLLFFGEDRGAGIRMYNLKPFSTLTYMLKYTAYKYPLFVAVNIFGNIIFFIPPGLILPSIFKRRKIWELFVLCVISLCLIEVLQYVLRVGVMDIDDVILNSAGALSGFLFYGTRKYLIRKNLLESKDKNA